MATSTSMQRLPGPTAAIVDHHGTLLPSTFAMSATLRLEDEPGAAAQDWERKLHAEHRAKLHSLILDEQSKLKETAAEIRQLEVDAIVEGKRDDAAAKVFSRRMTTAQSKYNTVVEILRERAEQQWNAAWQTASRTTRESSLPDYMKDFDVARGLDANVALWISQLHKSHVTRYKERLKEDYFKGVMEIAEKNFASGEAGQSSASDTWAQFEAMFRGQGAELRNKQNDQLRNEISRAFRNLPDEPSSPMSQPAAAAPRRTKPGRGSAQRPANPPLPSMSDTSHFPASLFGETRAQLSAFEQAAATETNPSVPRPPTRHVGMEKPNSHKRPRM